MADTMNPGLFAYLKSLLPGVNDQQVITAHDAVRKAVAAQGEDFDRATPEQQAAIYKQVIDQTGLAQKLGGQPATAQAAPQQVEIVGKRLPTVDEQIQQMPTPPKAPTQDASQLDQLYAGQGPTARRLQASDPDLMNQAVMQYGKLQGQDSPWQRAMSGFAAATREGIGGQAGAYSEHLKRMSDLDKAVTTERVKEAQALGQKGLEGANAALTTATQANVAQGDLDMRKRRFLIDQSMAGISLEQAEKNWDASQPLYDGKSKQSLAIAQAAGPVLKSFGVDPKLVAGMPAAEVMNILSGMKPSTDLQKQTMDQFLRNKELGIAGMNAQTSRMGVVSQNAARDTETRIAQAVTGATPGATPEQIRGNVTAGGFNWAGAGLTPSPTTTGLQSGAAHSVNQLRDAATGYETSGAGRAADTALSALGSARYIDTGKFGQTLAKIPGTDASGIRSSLAGYYTSKGMTPEQAAKEADAIFELSPRKAALRMAQIKADGEVLKRQLADQSTAAQAPGGLATFVPKSYVTFYNPKTGDVVLGDSAKDKPAGYINITQAGGK